MARISSGTGCAALGLLLSVTAALSQQQPTPFPWERDADRFFNQGVVPKYDNPLDRNIREGLRTLGLPDQPQLDTTIDSGPAPEPPGLSDTVLPELDANGNGYISRDEYFSARQRAPVVGGRGTERHLHRRDRMDSRFRTADSNRDGRLSAEEIDAMEGRRF
ncbi:MAG: EF-hand domain-containing protein [Rhodospirillaceae bacterium]